MTEQHTSPSPDRASHQPRSSRKARALLVLGMAHAALGATAATAAPSSRELSQQAPSRTCTTLTGESVALKSPDTNRTYVCLGAATTPLGHKLSILRQTGSSRSSKALDIVEHGKDGRKKGQATTPLAYPNYALPAHLDYTDAEGNTYTFELNYDLTYTLASQNIISGPTATGTPHSTRTATSTSTASSTPTPSSTPAPTRAPSETPLPYPTRTATLPAPVQQQDQTASAPAAEPTISPQEFWIEIEKHDELAAARKDAPEGQCLDSWGNQVPLGIDRPGDDDCLAISPNQPLKDHTTYTFQTEPGPDGKRQLIEVVVAPDGKISLNWLQNQSPQASAVVERSRRDVASTTGSLLTRIKSLLSIVFDSDAFTPGAVVLIPDSNSEEITTQRRFSSSSRLPSKDQLPRGVVSDATLEWYDEVSDVAVLMDYDPRSHLAFINVESKGATNLTSSAGAMGLIQIMPGTWADIRNTINNSPDLRQKAEALGIDPNSASPWTPEHNIFFSSVYLVVFCKMPLGIMPTGSGMNEYVEAVAWAAKRYHDGHNSDGSPPSYYGQQYMAEIRRILPGLAGGGQAFTLPDGGTLVVDNNKAIRLPDDWRRRGGRRRRQRATAERQMPAHLRRRLLPPHEGRQAHIAVSRRAS